MNAFVKRALCVFLALILGAHQVFGSAPRASANEEEFADTIEAQIRAFADSIDQANADERAAAALATHGITGRGSKMNVGEDHALTATLYNSELIQQLLIKGCSAAVRSMQTVCCSDLLDMSGNAIWSDDQEKGTLYALYESDEVPGKSKIRDWLLWSGTLKPENGNAYDEGLVWMAGITIVKITMQRIRITDSEVTYRVNCVVKDRFDFSTSNGSGFADLISGMGAILFREFDWESKITFDLKVPYSCTHSSGTYHWCYDKQNKQMISDIGDGYTENVVTRKEYLTNTDQTRYYYELSEPIRLYHDKPWVLEYDARNFYSLIIAPLEKYFAGSIPTIYQTQKLSYFLFKGYVNHGTESVYGSNYYGVPVSDYYQYSYLQPYTFRLENQLHADGSNMVYLSVWKKDTGEILVDNVPMDNYYRKDKFYDDVTLKSESDNRMNGVDLFINYIGNRQVPFSVSEFDLRIWENGVDGEG